MAKNKKLTIQAISPKVKVDNRTEELWEELKMDQTTEWVYGVTTGGGNGLTSNDIVGITKWPNKTTGAASSSEQDVVTVDASGATKTATDRNGNVHTLSYDVLGRIVSDAVTTLGSGVDGSVRRIETAYDSQGAAGTRRRSGCTG
jgi:YD repeat-containing protein